MRVFCSRFASPLLAALAYSQLAFGANTTNDEPVLLLSEDSDFHFQLLAGLAESVNGGADIGPILGAAKDLKAGSFESFHQRFYALANDTKAAAEDPENSYDPVNVRDTWFSAATYFRMADFYLHGNWSNPLIKSLWVEQTAAFDQGLAALPIPGERIRIPATNSNFTVEAIWYAASTSNGKNSKLPTLVIGNGYDAAQEDSYHTFVVPALARGWNCITYEGPGQPTVRRNQEKGFIPDWENVVTPVVDWLLSKQKHNVDKKQLVLLGNSMGGYLAARAAAFEPRFSALILDGGVWDIYSAYTGQLPDELLSLFESGNSAAFDETINNLLDGDDMPTSLRWGVEQGLWTFHTHSPFDFLTQTKQFRLKDVVEKIKMPVFVADAEFEGFFPGQAEQVKEALGDKATLHTFTGVAGYHCQIGAPQEMARTMFAWLGKTLSKTKTCQRSSHHYKC
ncbi:hypothetical protein G7Z17_g3919 [Cylindrodendrum hubeiense]|uniref:AB hydrolase-1 domain-containing protein n=1 Tax=Cylindrodendrum hubeiense TaxID=595255 RepID=A0A9P5H9X6_9HYPO|nr:hypothetical protein G7Z17_g3919 [Cylindrodendrum hubeiense]